MLGFRGCYVTLKLDLLNWQAKPEGHFITLVVFVESSLHLRYLLKALDLTCLEWLPHIVKSCCCLVVHVKTLTNTYQIANDTTYNCMIFILNWEFNQTNLNSCFVNCLKSGSWRNWWRHSEFTIWSRTFSANHWFSNCISESNNL